MVISHGKSNDDAKVYDSALRQTLMLDARGTRATP